jgi:uncharacterized protein (UPF0332 family)
MATEPMISKSQENIQAAHLLINKGKFSASVHCAYYSSFQYMKYIANNYLNVSYQTQNKGTGQDSHKFIWKQIENELMLNCHPIYDDCNTAYSFLRKLRKKADYLTQAISPAEANKAYTEAYKMNNLLKTNYK